MLSDLITTQIADALKAVTARETVADIFYVACGGSYALMLPNQYAIEREAATIAGQALNAAEFKARAPKRLGKNSIVILCSHSGTTPETVEAAQIARAAGALTIALTHVEGSPLDKASEYTINYTHEPMTMSANHSPAVLARLTFGILAARENNRLISDIDAGLAKIGHVVDKAIADQQNAIEVYAEDHKREPVIYTMASGANYGPAYSYAICIYQEMQWIHSACIHAGEYFHGPFEVTDFDVPFVQLIGVGASRDVDIRALTFAQKYSKRMTVLDAKDLGIDALPATVAEYLQPFVFSTVLRAYADKLANSKGHPLSVRRYMWKMEY